MKFSQGNLQYSNAGTHLTRDGNVSGTWRFADHQYDKIGSGNSQISSSYQGYIDLFGFGTSGYNENQPYLTSSNNIGTSIANTNYDWGEYNAISNGGNVVGQWRTLTPEEWTYIINSRSQSYRYIRANVMGVEGLVIFPDGFAMPSSIPAMSNVNSYTLHVIEDNDWLELENVGCVFLPYSGERRTTTLWMLDTRGLYHSTTKTYFLQFGCSGYNQYSQCNGYGTPFVNMRTDNNGWSVRLVQVDNVSVENITVTSCDNYTINGETYAASGDYYIHLSTPSSNGGDSAVMLHLTINQSSHTSETMVTEDPYSWHNQTYTTSGVYTFPTNQNGCPSADTLHLSVVGVGETPGLFSVSSTKTVSFSKGNLQYKASDNTWRFAEHQYDYIGSENNAISSTNSNYIDLFGWGTSGWNSGATCYQPYSH